MMDVRFHFFILRYPFLHGMAWHGVEMKIKHICFVY